MLADLRDRLLTRAGARALVSPAALLGGGVATGGAVAAGAPLALAGVAGTAVWSVLVVRQLPRSRRARTPELRGLQEPWRRYLVEAVAARQRFDTAIGQCEPGPLRRRLEQIGRRLEDGVAEVDRIARHGGRLDRVIRELEDPDEMQARLAEARSDATTPERDTAALAAQLASTEDIVRLAVETRQRLEVLDEQLDETVARVVELSLAPDGAEEAADLATRVDGMVTAMESLRVALDDTR